MREPEQARVEERHLPFPLATDEPVREERQRNGSNRHQQADRLAAFLPDEDPEHEAAHAEHGKDGSDEVDLPRPGVGHIVHELDLGQHDRDDDDLEEKADAPGQIGGDEPTEQRPDGGGDRSCCSDQRVGLGARIALEVPMDEGLHGGSMAGSSSDAPRPPTIAQKMMIAVRLCASVIAAAPTA